MSEVNTGLKDIYGGDYVVSVTTATTGTAKLQMTTSDHAAMDITDASWTAPATAAITLPKCKISKVVTAGDAQIFIKQVRS